jgi:hypothetical protein
MYAVCMYVVCMCAVCMLVLHTHIHTHMLLVYATLATSVCGLKLIVYAALRY